MSDASDQRWTLELSRQLLDILITLSLYPDQLFAALLWVLLFTLLLAGFVANLPMHVLRERATSDIVLLIGGVFAYTWLASRVFVAGLRRYSGGSRFGVFG